jgi:hypothetical protein
MTTASVFLSRADAAADVQSHGLALARGTLQSDASAAAGPRYWKFGQRCVDRREGLAAWSAVDRGQPVTSSSNRGAAARGRRPEGAPNRGSGNRNPAAVPATGR